MKLIYTLATLAVAGTMALGANAAPTNLVTNTDFPTDGTGWTNNTNAGTVTYNGDGSVTLSEGTGDNIVAQGLPTLDESKTYTFLAHYTTSDIADVAFCGFWNWDSDTEVPGWPGWDPYARISTNDDWTLVTATTTGVATRSVILAICKGGTVTYKDVYVVENPTLSVTNEGEEVSGAVVQGSTISVASSVEGYTLYYKLGDAEAVEIEDGSFVASEVGTYSVYAEFMGVQFGAKSVTVVDPDAPVNLMATAISAYNVLTVPGEPWYAYNTSTGAFGSGNGWQTRNEAGKNEATGESAQIFFRWNDNNSPWVYAYKVSLEANHNYDFSFDAATNDAKDNNVLVGMCQDLSQASSLDYVSTALSGTDNNNDVFNNGKHIATTFTTTSAGDYYVVFDGTLKSGNVIIRATNFELYDAGEAVNTEADYLAVKQEAEELLANESYVNVTGEEKTALEDLVAAENIEDYTQAIADLKDAMATFKAAKASYDSFAEANETAKQILADYTDASSEKIATLRALSSDPENAAAAVEATSALVPAYRAVIESHMIAEGVESSINKTDLIGCPNLIGGLEISSWTSTMLDGYSNGRDIRKNSGEGATLSDGSVRDYYFDSNNYNEDNWGVDFSQTITTLDKGKYRLSVLARGSVGLSSYEMYADEDSVAIEHVGNSGNLFNRGWNFDYLDFTVDTVKDVTIGVKLEANAKSCWASFDNFQLVQLSASTGVSELESELGTGEAEYYNLNGMKVSSDRLEKGIYIVRQGGKVTKVIK